MNGALIIKRQHKRRSIHERERTGAEDTAWGDDKRETDVATVVVRIRNAHRCEAFHDERSWILKRPNRPGPAAYQQSKLRQILADRVVGSLQTSARRMKGELDGGTEDIG